ncbi:3-oxoacyl-[acyl-carrier-protein] synthase 2 [Clostridium tepidiprofundi DSM 19306]|uniref:3-oxoacyl-[acyl-carrier-protein] synthase 2 n=1 Tax=Clostridium tepidiprofundi DSM 19306 TaxID=1121338 RepID=A0A151B4M5_9CLOT|nr:beta-ketoacyl-ACP synthase II [Clostridium tepidiprofundi]KYH34871.1 3-oxoacyl-[acyl-carrier-protein] synthase 2 [Clostridium tepidiprofundi DSM 19306]
MSNRVVITGIGVVSPIGNNIEEFWNGIREGKCGIDNISAFDASNFKVKVAGEVKDFNPEVALDKREARRMDRYCQLAMVAAKEAVEDSKLDIDSVNKERFGVIIGSGIGGLSTMEKEHEKLLNKGPNRVSPFMIPMLIGNMASGNVAIKYGAKGICTAVVTACATGTNAVGDAYRAIKYGLADIMITGGAEAAVTPLAVAGFTSLTALSKSEDPKRASIPFDKDRDGFVMGEGAGILILESLDNALARGAKIYAEIIGYGETCDAHHITAPAPGGEGGARAMKLAIQEGGIQPEDVSYINAHGTSTYYNDKYETEAIKTVLGKHAYEIPVNSTKSMTGHLLGATGAVEAIVCAKSLQEGFVHATVGLREPDEGCDLDYVMNEGRDVDIKYALSNSLGFGGHNATLLFRKWEGK